MQITNIFEERAFGAAHAPDAETLGFRASWPFRCFAKTVSSAATIFSGKADGASRLKLSIF